VAVLWYLWLVLQSFLVLWIFRLSIFNGCYYLKITHPVWVPDNVANCPRAPFFHFFLLWCVRGDKSESDPYPHVSSSYAASNVVSLFGGGLTLHNALTLISHNLVEDMIIWFLILGFLFQNCHCLFLTNLSLMQWRDGMVCHPILGGGQILGPTTALGPCLRLSMMLYD
jgi:hypothetical protein